MTSALIPSIAAIWRSVLLRCSPVAVAVSIGGRWDAARRRSDRGAGFVEYGLLLVLITAACVVSIRVLGISVSDRFTSASTAITGAP